MFFFHHHARYRGRSNIPRLPQNKISLLLVGLVSCLGSLASHFLGGSGLDNTDGDGLDTHGLAGEQLDDGGVTRLDELGSVLSGLSGTSVHLLQDFGKLTGNVRCVAIKHRRVAVGNLSGWLS